MSLMQEITDSIKGCDGDLLSPSIPCRMMLAPTPDYSALIPKVVPQNFEIIRYVKGMYEQWSPPIVSLFWNDN